MKNNDLLTILASADPMTLTAIRISPKVNLILNHNDFSWNSYIPLRDIYQQQLPR